MNFLCSRIGFPKEASDYVYSVYNGITHNKIAYNDLMLARTSFLSPNSKEYNSCIQRIHENTGVNIYTINLVLVLICAKNVKALPAKTTFATISAVPSIFAITPESTVSTISVVFVSFPVAVIFRAFST